jgi:signal transduction histidine kinase
MLHEFLTANHDRLIARCKAKVARRTGPQPFDPERQHGIPLFLEQLVNTLQLEQTHSTLASLRVSGPPDTAKTPVYSEIGMAAATHGSELLRQGLSVDQVVHDYGDLCQSITELAAELRAPVTVEEFHTLNRCLDNAIADAVTEFSRQRDNLISTEGAQAMGERLNALAHELRNLLDCAMLSVEAIKRGNVGVRGSTSIVLDRALVGLRNVVDQSLANVRLAVGMPVQGERIDLAEFIAEVKVSGQLEANARGCAFTGWPVEEGLALFADRQMLSSAVANLLQNAFKFTRAHSHVSLKAYAAADRVLIEIEDECGGLPHGTADKLFRPFEQGGIDRSGLGLGLPIAQRSVEANRGAIRVRDRPGTGCTFIIDLPLAPQVAADPAIVGSPSATAHEKLLSINLT